MNRPTLLLDMDGPLADFDQHAWDVCGINRWKLNIDSLDDPRRRRFLTDNMLIRRERDMLRSLINETMWFRYLPVTAGAVDGVPELMEHFDVWVCTKPLEANRWCLNDKHSWLVRHFPALAGKMITAPDKSLIFGDILLDDAPKPADVSQAFWRPVIFRSVFNGCDSEWGHLPSWSWGDPISQLTGMVPS